MGTKRSGLDVRTMIMVTHKKSLRPAQLVAQALRSGVSIALGKSFGRLASQNSPSYDCAKKFGPEQYDRDDGDCMAQIQELQEQLNRLQAVDRRRRVWCGSWPLQASRLMTPWRSTWKPNSLQPSHHGDHALRLRSLNWCPPSEDKDED